MPTSTGSQFHESLPPCPWGDQVAPARLSDAQRDELAAWTEQVLRSARDGKVSSVDMAKSAVILAHLWLADSLARRYRNRGADADDLLQEARRGLVEAVDRYDPDHGSFVTFAIPTITGLIKRHFRDHSWLVRPPRTTQRLCSEVRQSWSTTAQRIGAVPSLSQIAHDLHEPVDAVREAVQAGQGYSHTTLDIEKTSFRDDTENAWSHVEARVIIGRACRQLDPGDRDLLFKRFIEERSQSDIAAELGTNQMHVSRRLSRLLDRLRELIGSSEQSVA